MPSPITPDEARKFGAILARAFSANVECNPHKSGFCTIREHLHDHRSDPEDEAIIAACEATGEVWECAWWSSSCGHFDIIAPSWPALVREVIEAAPQLLRADERGNVKHDD